MAKPSRSTHRPEMAFSAKAPARKGGRTPERLAKAAVARMPTTVSGHRVKVTPTLFLTHQVAGYVVARAIREGKNTPGVIADILTAESWRK